MSFSSDKTLSLTFNEVEALLSAIVDCDPALHQKLEKFVDECKFFELHKNTIANMIKEHQPHRTISDIKNIRVESHKKLSIIYFHIGQWEYCYNPMNNKFNMTFDSTAEER